MIKHLVLAGIVGLLIFTHVVSASAQEVPPSPTPTPTPVDYQLSYPGILPGHPFYFLKEIRDNLVGFFVSGPIKKVEFDRLQSDKSISAASLLFQNKKNTEAVAALTKGGDYFADALDRTKQAKQQGIDTSELVKTLFLSNTKHEEVVSGMLKTASSKDRDQIDRELDRIHDFAKKIQTLRRH